MSQFAFFGLCSNPHSVASFPPFFLPYRYCRTVFFPCGEAGHACVSLSSAGIMVPIMAKRELDEMALAQPSNGLHKAVQVLRDLIVMGHLAPGSRLTEAELAERLHLSRTPIRGALLWLQREGYVLAAPGKVKTRIMVAPLTHGDASEIYAIIGRLEGLAARNAAQLPDAK